MDNLDGQDFRAHQATRALKVIQDCPAIPAYQEPPDCLAYPVGLE